MTLCNFNVIYLIVITKLGQDGLHELTFIIFVITIKWLHTCRNDINQKKNKNRDFSKPTPNYNTSWSDIVPIYSFSWVFRKVRFFNLSFPFDDKRNSQFPSLWKKSKSKKGEEPKSTDIRLNINVRIFHWTACKLITQLESRCMIHSTFNMYSFIVLINWVNNR